MDASTTIDAASVRGSEDATMRLVAVDRPARCAVCSRPVYGEGRRWIGETVVHLACASELAGPGGR